MKVTAREKKFLIGGAAIALAGILFYFGETLVPNRAILAKQVEGQKRALLRQREMLNQEEFFKAKVLQYQRRLKQDYTLLMPGDNPSIAGAELQRILKSLADQNGVEIVRRDIQREQKLQNNLVKVAVRIETNCMPDQLVQFLSAVENYERFLTVDELAVTSFRIAKRWEIRPSITVAGLIAVAESKPAEKPAGGPPAGGN
jgi:type II secretory pathway component PulM